MELTIFLQQQQNAGKRSHVLNFPIELREGKVIGSHSALSVNRLLALLGLPQPGYYYTGVKKAERAAADEQVKDAMKNICESKPFYPYLLRDVKIVRPNQVRSTGITYTKVNGSKAYVIAIIDWFSRMILVHRTVNTMDASYCVGLLHEAVRKYGLPEIFNSVQGSQFTSHEFTETRICVQLSTNAFIFTIQSGSIHH